MEPPFSQDFVTGLTRVARRRYWRQRRWVASEHDVLSILAVRCLPLWRALCHAPKSESRIQQASWLGHKHRSYVVNELNKAYLRKRILRSPIRNSKWRRNPGRTWDEEI